ncbi:MarR family winged helix-turn-helix transcriptional regulator [Ferrovibrio sp.]|uniref:MarR family winged helix-turn-helix transcriptional regulator n=1 Tax=Ferrovibrio sp. TaxID=1917215 RepID=UPI0035B38115
MSGPASDGGAVAPLVLDDYLPYLINRAGVSLVQRFGAVLREEGLGIQDWRALAALYEIANGTAIDGSGGVRLSDLSERTAIEISTLSRVVAGMERNGMLLRERDASDARAVAIRLTPRGLCLAAKLIPAGTALEQVALAGLDAAEATQLKALLRRIYTNLKAAE